MERPENNLRENYSFKRKTYSLLNKECLNPRVQLTEETYCETEMVYVIRLISALLKPQILWKWIHHIIIIPTSVPIPV